MSVFVAPYYKRMGLERPMGWSEASYCFELRHGAIPAL